VRRLWSAYAINQAGSSIGAGALPLVAILLLDVSDWQITLLAAVAALAGAAAAVPLGPWIDFHHKRPTLIGADLLRCVSLASVPIAAAFNALTFSQLCLVAVAQTVGTTSSVAANAAYLKDMVPAHQLTVVNSRWETTMWSTNMIGPPLGGVLVTSVGALATVIIDAASFLLSALRLGRIRHREPTPPTPSASQSRLTEMTAGWSHIAAHRVLRALFAHALLLSRNYCCRCNRLGW
jgi:MFS family permease